jgi:hypothetical protein
VDDDPEASVEKGLSSGGTFSGYGISPRDGGLCRLRPRRRQQGGGPLSQDADNRWNAQALATCRLLVVVVLCVVVLLRAMGILGGPEPPKAIRDLVALAPPGSQVTLTHVDENGISGSRAGGVGRSVRQIRAQRSRPTAPGSWPEATTCSHQEPMGSDRMTSSSSAMRRSFACPLTGRSRARWGTLPSEGTASYVTCRPPEQPTGAATAYPASAARMAARWAGMLPQQAPMIVVPAPRKRVAWTAIEAGVAS